MIGTTIAHYEITGLLGKGGMGEVYRARDTKLDREVALKVLPSELADNAERLARLQREAKVLASLNHPNIAAIHGLEEVGGKVILVMELAEGDELVARIQGGLPQEQALELARQIAEGLEEAHAKSIVHRDLKPANIKVSPDGRVKILDFGLARAFVNETDPEIDSAMSPTITGMHTMAGTIIGTAAYMSPEQARGITVDKRADIFAFGTILYEMLSGRQLFDGNTVSDKLAAILKSDPDWDLLPADMPPRLRELLERCLAKQRRARMQDIGDARIEIEKIQAGDTGYAPADSTARRGLPFGPALVGAVLLAAVVGLGTWFLAPRGESGSDLIGAGNHVSYAVPTDLKMTSALSSPDGQVAYTAYPADPPTPEDNLVRLFLRRPDSFQFEPVPGSESLRGYAFSPDGGWLAYVAPEKSVAGVVHLWKIPTDLSAPPLKIRIWPDTWNPSAIHWLADGDLVASNGQRELVRVPMDGRPSPAPLELEETEGGFRFRPEPDWSSALPDGVHLLSTIETWDAEGYAKNIHAINVNTGKVKLIMENGGNARWLDTGHLVFSRGTSILAVGFNPTTLEVQGGLVAVADGLRTEAAWDHGSFGFSRTGHLYFHPGGLVGQQQTLAWTDRHFRTFTPWSEDRFAFDQPPVVSPDGRFVAAVIASPNGTFDTWISRLDRPGFRRFASEKGRDITGELWTPDGSQLFMNSFFPGSSQILVNDAVGSSEARLVHELEAGNSFLSATGVADEGRTLIIGRRNGGQFFLETKSLAEGPDVPTTTILEDAHSARLSPDGRWLVYESTAGGQSRVQVRAWLGEGTLGQAHQVSSDAAASPFFYKEGPEGPLEIWFFNEAAFWSVTMTGGSDPEFSRPTFIVDWNVVPKGFDILRDGRILVRREGPDEKDPRRLDVILNWKDSIQSSLPTGR